MFFNQPLGFKELVYLAFNYSPTIRSTYFESRYYRQQYRCCTSGLLSKLNAYSNREFVTEKALYPPLTILLQQR
jgi:hypothetical protein